MIKLAISDMDNTLIPLGAAHVSSEAIYAIHKLHEAGVAFGPCTGRDVMELEWMFRGDKSCFATGILSNGKKVMVDGQIVDLHLFAKDSMERLVDALAELPRVFANIYPLAMTPDNKAWAVNAPSGMLAGYERRFKYNATVVSKVPDEKIIAISIAFEGPEERREEIRRAVKAAAPELDLVSPANNWIDVVPHGVNKASAFGVLTPALGVKPEEVAVFGDAENDQAVMREAPNSVAVANAVPVVAEAARWHVGACLDEGVPIALQEIARATKAGEMPSFMREEGEA